MGFDFLDLDVVIEQKENLTINELFQNKGEIQFRKTERRVLETVCRTHDCIVLALGGGTPCYGDTMKFLTEHPNVITIYLKSSIETLHNRLVDQRNLRPLLAQISEENLSEFIAKHVFERSKFYNQSQLIVTVDNKSVTEIASEISEELN